MAQIKLYMVHFLYGTDMAQIWDIISGPYMDQIWDFISGHNKNWADIT